MCDTAIAAGRRLSRAALLAAVAALLVTLPACADAQRNSAGDDRQPVAQKSEPEDGRTHAVQVKNIAFEPDELRVPAGATVGWTSADDGVAHTVTSGKPGDVGVPGVAGPRPGRPDGAFDGALADAGTTFRFTFDQTGTFDYYCAVHPSMTGRVVVR